MKVIEVPGLRQPYALDEFTKELMGREWVANFDKWAVNNLPDGPGCLMDNQFIYVHPALLKEFKNTFK